MKRLYVLLSVALSMAALCAVAASSASAETFAVLCKSVPASHECLDSSTYPSGTEVTASGSKVDITGVWGETLITCSESSIKMKYNGTHGLEYQSASFTGCSTVLKDATNGELILKWKEGTDNATFNTFGELFEMTFSGKTGTYGFQSEAEGIELVGGTSPKLVFNKAPLVGKSGQTLSNLKFSAQYNLSPTPIYVEKPATLGVLCKSAPVSNHCEAGSVYPEGTEFTATQVPGTNMKMVGSFGETFTECKGSSIKLKYDGDSELEYVSSSYSECSRPTSDSSNGALVVKYNPGSSELFAGSGQLVEIKEVPVFGTVTFGLKGDGIKLTQGSSPQLELASAAMVETGKYPTMKPAMTGKYNLSPTPVYVGEA